MVIQSIKRNIFIHTYIYIYIYIIFSYFHDRWILRTFWIGYHRDLEVSDLYKPLKEHTSSILGEKLATLWEAECQRINEKKNKAVKSDEKLDDESNLKEPSLLKVLIKCFGARIMVYGIILVIMEIVLR